MINVLHLLWIIPLSVLCGIFLASIAHASADADRKIAELLEEE